MSMTAVRPMPVTASVREESPADVRAALARIPVGRPLTPKESVRMAEARAYVAGGGRVCSTEEVLAEARSLSRR